MTFYITSFITTLIFYLPSFEHIMNEYKEYHDHDESKICSSFIRYEGLHSFPHTIHLVNLC